MLVTSKEMFEEAKKRHFAVPAANYLDADMVKAHIRTAEELGLPLILGLAQSHLNYLIDLEEGAEIGKYYGEKASVPVVLHLDHGEDIETAKKAVDLGFTSVMIDASTDPIEENIRKTKEVAEYAHSKGVVVEAEIGHVGTGETYSGDSDSIYTAVEDAVRFASESGADSLAVSIGTAHGLYKGTPKINFERLRELKEAVSIPLVLHGGSSSGDDNLRRCASGGIAKINIYSDLVLAAAAAVQKMPQTGETGVWDYVAIKHAARDGMTDCLKHCYEIFGTQKI